MLSAAPIFHPNLIATHKHVVTVPSKPSALKNFKPLANILPPTDGFFPAEISHAYGFDLSGATGAGQTIAIVDAYNNPSIRPDLAEFDAQFGLPAPPKFTIVNQDGGSVLTAQTDFGWAGETALDVEWAHAMAPGANILLVVARSATTANLLAAVNYARNVPGVSVISMSWGSIESIAESADELKLNQTFTTPAGHQGITFVASSGDSDTTPVSFPGSSANILGVGGTSLVLDGAGNYGSETSWNDLGGGFGGGFGFGGSTGGFSNVEAAPYYQAPVIASDAFLGAGGVARRAVPDVSYNADPQTGFAVYDAFSAFSVDLGWYVVGGTSAGAPQWSSIIALADQQRVASGKTTLDGFTQTLPALYNLYHNPGTAGYATYTTYFHDIDDDVSLSPKPATPGYDLITGLGTPHVPQVLQALLVATTATNTAPPTPAITTLPPSGAFITGVILSPLPITTGPGDTVSLNVRLTNITAGLYSAPMTISFFASTTSVGGYVTVGSITLKHLKLQGGKSKKVTFKLPFPDNLAFGDYFFTLTTNTDAVSAPSAG